MAGSIISGTITNGITLGAAPYLSPLTITSTGGIDVAAAHNDQPGIYVPAALRNANITNYGTVIAGQTGTVIDFAGQGSLINYGVIAAPVYYDTPAPPTCANGVVLGPGAHLTNFGTISGGGSYNYSNGTFANGGVGVIASDGLDNFGYISGGRSGHNGGNGVQGGGQFFNTGRITGGGGYNFGGVGVLLDQNANLLNRGYISGGDAFVYHGGGYHGGNGVDLNGGTLLNAGFITGGVGLTGIGGTGVDMNGGVLVNSGRITGGFGAYTEGTGVILNGGTIIDRGVIAGHSYYGPPGPAVMFGSLAGTLVVEPGAVFHGKVIADAAAHDVLAAYGTSATPLSGIGTEFLNFSTIAIDKHAIGTIAGNVSGLATGQSITGFHQGDTLVLDGFKAVSGTYASGIGVELNNDTTIVTLDITGSFNPADLRGSSSNVGTTISLADTVPITLGTDRSTFTFVAAGQYSHAPQGLASPWLHAAELAPSIPSATGPAFNTNHVNAGIAGADLLANSLSGTQAPLLLHNQNKWLHQG